MDTPCVFVFIADGCPACHQYAPVARNVLARTGYPYRVYDLAKATPRVAAFANQLGVKVTPTTILLHNGKLTTRKGALTYSELSELLRGA